MYALDKGRLVSYICIVEKEIYKMNLSELTKLNEEQSREYIESIVWKDGIICPHCGHKKAYKITGKSVRKGLRECADCKEQFTVTVGTIMQGSHLPLRKWAMAFHLLCSSKKGFSALQLQRNLGIGSYRTALFMFHRIRFAMKEQPVKDMLRGTIEVDETYIGGKPRNRGNNKRGRGTKKAPVLLMVERNGKARTKPVTNVNSKTLKNSIREVVHKDSTIMTDEWKSYRGIGNEFAGGHKVVNHGNREYVCGIISTNTAESFFAIMKRGINGIYHSVSKKHLKRYCDEYSFRWNRRYINDGERTDEAIKNGLGKRLIYN